MSAQPRMYYFGPWREPGHYVFEEGGYQLPWQQVSKLPWMEKDHWTADGGIEPQDKYKHVDGAASLVKKEGWTALAMWDASVDKRLACVSVYIAEGDFTFEQMVDMACRRFATRWSRMKFPVKLIEGGKVVSVAMPVAENAIAVLALTCPKCHADAWRSVEADEGRLKVLCQSCGAVYRFSYITR